MAGIDSRSHLPVLAELTLLGLTLVPTGLTAQALGFEITAVTVSRQQLPGNGTKYTVTSTATYPKGGRLHRDATHGTSIDLAGVPNSPFSHTIQGRFHPGQTFVCGSFSRNVFAPLPCGATGFRRNFPCSSNRTLMSSAKVVTTGGLYRSYPSWGGTAEWLTCTPEPPPLLCGDSYELTGYHHLDLGGRASVMRSTGTPSRPLIHSEEVAGKHYFRNEFLIAERDPATGRYVATTFTSGDFAAEGARVLNRSAPPGLGPETVFLLQGAEHPRTEDWAPPPLATFEDGFRSGRGFAPRAARPTRDEGDGPVGEIDDETWRFLARFDVRESGEREAEILWAEGAVDEVWLSTLRNTLELAGDVHHRVVVYALVEVDVTVRVGQRISVMPQCCCGEVLCK